jgi:hypothetical protein
MSSTSLLFEHALNETIQGLTVAAHGLLDFVLPKWSPVQAELPSLRQLWEHAAVMGQNVSVADNMLRHFDTNHDGTISYAELMNMTVQMKQWAALNIPRPHPETWSMWFTREWPLMDWKVGVFLWQSFGGVLALLALLSVVPGRLHGLSARVLRWPVLGLTYFLVIVELMVYVVIRMGIRLAEYLVAVPKHRKMRREMAQAQSYAEWYAYAAELDQSQKRDRWLRGVDDHTSYRYNWAFIRELIKDMRLARANGDALLALAVIQQCTRKNVGGIMSEDLFSYSNTGEPKVIVREFIEEVVTTLHWITDDALKAPVQNGDENLEQWQQYDKTLENKIRNEKKKNRSGVPSFGLPGLQHQRYDDSQGSAPSENGAQNGNGSRPLPSVHHRERVLEFLKRARAAYGRTALCLSGGSMMGCYHFGTLWGMLETGTLPHIISGTSAGAVVGSILCTRTDEELKRDFSIDVLDGKLTCFERSWRERVKSVMENGNMFAFDDWMKLIQWYVRSVSLMFATDHSYSHSFRCRPSISNCVGLHAVT